MEISMPNVELSKKQDITDLPYPESGQVYYWDTNLPGFGVCVGKKSKSYVVQRDVRGRSQRMRVGRFGKIPLAKAKKKAKVLMGQMAGDTNPYQEGREARAHNMTLREAWALYETHLAAKERSDRTGEGYWKNIGLYLSDWLDKPLVEISRINAQKRHAKIGRDHGKYAANGTMRALRAIWRRARRQHPALSDPPTLNVDWFKERRRTEVLKVDVLPDWYSGVMSLPNPIRRDLYLFLLFTGLRSEEARSIRWEQVDFESKSIHFPKTKTEPFDLPLSDYLMEILEQRRDCEFAAKEHEGSQWVFPAFSKMGHIAEAKLSARERNSVKVKFAPHLLRRTFITISENKVSMPYGHTRLLVNHSKLNNGDAHDGYNHPDIDDFRRSQQAMTDYLKSVIEPSDGPDNVVKLHG